MWFAARKKEELVPESRRLTSDAICAFIIAAVWGLHIYYIFAVLIPTWVCCFPFSSFGQYLWPAIAIYAAGFTVRRAMRVDVRHNWRWIHFSLAGLLILFAVDTWTGGDYRWFEVALRRELAKCGGPDRLQTWAERDLESVKNPQDQQMDPNDLPPDIRAFAADFREGASYLFHSNGIPKAIMFNNGGWTGGWGIIVGRPDLTNGSPFGDDNLRGYWAKEIQPGVWIYYFTA